MTPYADCWVSVVGCCHRSRSADAWRVEPVREYIATSTELCGEQKWFNFFKFRWSRTLLNELNKKKAHSNAGEDDKFLVAFKKALGSHADLHVDREAPVDSKFGHRILPVEPTIFWAPETFCVCEEEQDSIEVLYRFVIPPTNTGSDAESHDPCSVPLKTRVAIQDAVEKATGLALRNSIEQWIRDVDIKDRYKLKDQEEGRYEGAAPEVLQPATWRVVSECPEPASPDQDFENGAPDMVVLVNVKVKLPEWQVVARKQVLELDEKQNVTHNEKVGLCGSGKKKKALPDQYGAIVRPNTGSVATYMMKAAIGNLADGLRLGTRMALAALLIGYFSNSYLVEFSEFAVTPAEYCKSASSGRFVDQDCFMVTSKCPNSAFHDRDFGYTEEFPCDDFTSSGNGWLLDSLSTSNVTEVPWQWATPALGAAAIGASYDGLNVTCYPGNFGSTLPSGAGNAIASNGNATSLRPYHHLICYKRKPSGLQLASFVAAVAIANTVSKILLRSEAAIQAFPVARSNRNPRSLRCYTLIVLVCVSPTFLVMLTLVFPSYLVKEWGALFMTMKEASSITSVYGLIMPFALWCVFTLKSKWASHNLAHREFLIDTIDARRKLAAEFCRQRMYGHPPPNPSKAKSEETEAFRVKTVKTPGKVLYRFIGVWQQLLEMGKRKKKSRQRCW